MNTATSSQPRSKIVYPETDGEPMAENTLQFQWIVTIKEGLEAVFLDQPDVFVAGDLFWYPVEGDPTTRTCAGYPGRLWPAEGASQLVPAMAGRRDRAQVVVEVSPGQPRQ